MSVTSASASEVESERDYLARTAAASLVQHESYLGGASPAAARVHPNPRQSTATPPRYGATAATPSASNSTTRERGPSPMYDAGAAIHSPPAFYLSQQQQQHLYQQAGGQRHVHFGPQHQQQGHHHHHQQQQARVPIIVSDDIVSGSKQDGWMSPVRRFFVLFVTFDVILTALLWAITIIVTGRDVEAAVKQQILEYTIHDSMFDCVVRQITAPFPR